MTDQEFEDKLAHWRVLLADTTCTTVLVPAPFMRELVGRHDALYTSQHLDDVMLDRLVPSQRVPTPAPKPAPPQDEPQSQVLAAYDALNGPETARQRPTDPSGYPDPGEPQNARHEPSLLGSGLMWLGLLVGGFLGAAGLLAILVAYMTHALGWWR